MPVKQTTDLKFAGVNSNILYVAAKTLATILIPNDPAFNGITCTFKVGIENNNLFTLKDMNGVTVSVALSANSAIALELPYFAGITHIQLVASGSLTDKSITVIFREL